MLYIRIINEEIIYPYQIGNLRKDYPQTSFPKEQSLGLLANYNIYSVLETDPPTYDQDTHSLIELEPLLINNIWVQQWDLRLLTEEELFEKIPKFVTALQGMRVIKEMELVESFVQWKNSLDQIEDFEVLSFLDKAQNWVYDDPILNNALISLNLIEQKDNLFKLANTL
jgi:hypothetical protein